MDTNIIPTKLRANQLRFTKCATHPKNLLLVLHRRIILPETHITLHFEHSINVFRRLAGQHDIY